MDSVYVLTIGYNGQVLGVFATEAAAKKHAEELMAERGRTILAWEEDDETSGLWHAGHYSISDFSVAKWEVRT